MKTFDEIYEELQNADNKELNEAWNKLKKNKNKANKASAIICLIINALILMVFYNAKIEIKSLFIFMPIIMFIIIINLFAVIIVNLIFTGKDKNKYSNIYKKVVIKKLINNFYDNLEYFPQKEMPEYIYEEGKYDEYYDTYSSEDYFEACINNKYSIQMAEVVTEEEQEYEDSEGETQTRVITKFHGLFAKIDMYKSINSQLKIMRDGEILKKDRLEMDSSEFEKYFDVKTSNNIVGMQLLTADVMQELIDFLQKEEIDFDIYINNNYLYLRFHLEDMFEVGKIKNGPIEEKTLEKYYNILKFTYDLSNKLINVVNDTEL